MKITIHQPSYWPWLGLLDKIAKVEKYVIMDDVAADKSSFQYRNQFFCDGKSVILTLPVDYKLGKKINELHFKNDTWKMDHLNKLKNYYRKAPYFKEIFPRVEALYFSYNEIDVFPFLLRTMKFAFDMLNIDVDIIKSSDLDSTGKKGDLVLSICKAANAGVYLSGQGARNYLTEEQIGQFEKNKIKLEWHCFELHSYKQNQKFEFVPGLACLDMFFWNGKEKSLELFWKNIKNKKGETNENNG